ncbi:MAG: Asp-tRNA(Asn)/Glu-tRNA(Gln) amidotransferase subunit GatC [Myxococcota bacterium]
MSGSYRIDPSEVCRVADLARLTLSDAEVAQLTSDLGAILDYVRQLEELDIDGVEPTSHAIDLPTRMRGDEVRDGLPTELGLRGAPERLANGFGVPKIIE